MSPSFRLPLLAVVGKRGRERDTRQVIAVAEYVFTFAVIASDREGYYYDDWSRASRFEVIGETKSDALDSLWPILGTAPRGRFWKARHVGAAVDLRLRSSPGASS
jgi:hypothetical protein